MDNILIIEVNWLGDILFTTPAIRAIRESYPSVYIGCLVVPRCVELLEDNPNINEIITFDEKGRHRGILGRLSLILELRKKNFDTAISFHRSMSRMLIAYISGIKRRIGYSTLKRFWLLTDGVSMPRVQPHRVEYFLNITRAVGIDTDNKDYEFNIPKGLYIRADEVLRQAGISGKEEFFVINPGGNWPPKRWPQKNYADLCKELNARYGKRVIITGSEKDIPLAQDIASASGNSAVSICGKTNLKELAAVMKRAILAISNDSGPMHIAVSQRVPTIAIFGPTSPKITGPYGSGRYIVLHKWFDCETPCYKTCEDYRCMEAVSVIDVMEAVEKIQGEIR